MKIANRLKSKHFIILFSWQLIMVSLMSIEAIGDFYKLGLGVLIFILQILLTIYTGYLGAVSVVIFNIIGLVVIVLDYNSTLDRMNIGVSLFLFSSLFGCMILAYFIEKNWRILKKIEGLNNVDSVTGVYNHRYFLIRIFSEIARAKRSSESISLIRFDIDHFDNINNLFGIKYGDELLRKVSRSVLKLLREYDTLFRNDADKFSIILPNTNSKSATEIAKRIISSTSELKKDPFFKEKELYVTLSLGYSIYPELAQSGDDLITQSKSAHYNSKQSGRNKYSLYFDIFTHVKSNLKTTDLGFMDKIKMVLWTLTSKDQYTYGHSERVARYSIDLGRAIGLGADEITDLEITALLHDVGKIDIPLDVLNKPGRLTEEEFALIKAHPIESKRMLKPLNYITGLLDGVMFHHEKYNGKGYPHGLIGDQIPLYARIISIADAYDAMRSDRPYREGLTIEQVKEIMIENLGEQFDPELGATFIESCLINY